jgi:hypothetical protein
MPLSHLLWRLADGHTHPMQIAVSCRCAWPYCPVQALDLTLRLAEPREPKPAEAPCPLCRRPLHVLSAKPLASEERRRR